MTTLIVAAPGILPFEKTNESICARLLKEGFSSYTLFNNNEEFFNESHKSVQSRILKNPEINKAVLNIVKISKFFYRSRYQRFLYTSQVDISEDKFYKSKIREIDNLAKLMPDYISDQNELKKFVSKIESKYLYYVLISSYMTQYFITVPKNIKKQFIVLAMKEYFRYFSIVKKIIKQKKISSLVIYNGRQIRFAAAYHAGLSLGIKSFKFYESFLIDKCSYVLTSKPIHYMDSYSQDIKNKYQKNTDFGMGYIYIGRRFEGRETGYLANFQKNRFSKLYENSWQQFIKDLDLRGRKLISIFTSSEYEKSSLELNDLFTGENMAKSLEYLLERKIFPANSKLVLRAHPHSKNRDIDYQNQIKNICKKFNIFYISAERSLDSYKLISITDFCISFGSTISAEAALLMKPSISIGKSLHNSFGCSFYPSSIEEIENFFEKDISKKYLQEKQSNAIKYFSAIHNFSRPIVDDIFYTLEFSILVKKLLIFFLRKFYTTKNKLKKMFYVIFLRKRLSDLIDDFYI